MVESLYPTIPSIDQDKTKKSIQEYMKSMGKEREKLLCPTCNREREIGRKTRWVKCEPCGTHYKYVYWKKK
jgi:hypothetical protein